MIVQETNRTIVEKIVDGNTVIIKKIFKDGWLQKHPNTITRVVGLLQSALSPILPTVINVGSNFYTLKYYPYTLTEYIANSMANINHFAESIALGLFDLWRYGVIHNDVHGNNIVVSADGVNLKLIDFERISVKPRGIPFANSPDLIGGGNTHAHWDKHGQVDLSTILKLGSQHAIEVVRQYLINQLKASGGAYYERISKGQIYGSYDLPGFKVDGRRDPKARLDQFNVDLTNKTVLDLGCNAGSMSFEAINRGAASVVGLELITQRVEVAKSISHFVGLNHKMKFLNINFDINNIDALKSDVVFAFAIDHQTADIHRLYHNLYHITNETLLFETSRQPEYQEWCKQQLMNAGFKSVVYIGESSASDKKHRSRMDYICHK